MTAVHRSFILFTYLQIMDLSTTALFLLAGVQEANPLIKMLLRTDDPFAWLIAIKLLVILGACWCIDHFPSVLVKANFAYGAIVLWNITAVIFSAQR